MRDRYAKRETRMADWAQTRLNFLSMRTRHDRDLALAELFRTHLAGRDISQVNCIEVGCGLGGNLLQLMQLGFAPQNLIGIELLEDRAADASLLLPESIKIIPGDALELDILPRKQDIVYQSLVFSSILDDEFQQKLACKMWDWLTEDGAILWYDFTYNNPKNSDVRGVPVKRIRELFPEGRISLRRITLAPPLARRLVRLHPGFYGALNLFPFLRTHVLCWIEKMTDQK